MIKLFFFLFLTVFLKGQNNSLFIDGVAAIVEDKIVEQVLASKYV